MNLFQTLPVLCALAAAPSLRAQQWTSLGGEAVDVASAAGQVYAIRKDQTIAYYSGGQWLAYPGGGKGTSIDVDSNGTPYVVGTTGHVYRGTGQGWVALPPPPQGFSRVAVDGKGVVWATSGYKNLFRLDGDRWTGAGTAVNGIAGDPRGGLLIISGGNRAHRLGSGDLPGSPACSDIASDAAGNAFVISTDGVLHGWNGNGFTASAGGLYPTGLSIGSGGEIFVIGKADNAVWMWGNAVVGGGGGNTGGGGATPANRIPNAPTPLGPANTYDPPVITNPGQRPASVRLSWRDNGDPEGDQLGFYVHITRWDPASQTWPKVFAGYATEAGGFTFTPQHGLADVGYYAWTVVAVDLSGKSDPPAASSPWQYFMATRALE